MFDNLPVRNHGALEYVLFISGFWGTSHSQPLSGAMLRLNNCVVKCFRELHSSKDPQVRRPAWSPLWRSMAEARNSEGYRRAQGK